MVATTSTLKPGAGPKGHFLLGSMSDFQNDSVGFFQRLAANYGDIARFRLGPFTAYLLIHPEHVQQVLVKDAAKFHKSQVIKLALGKFVSNGLVSTDGDFWAKQRKLVQPAFHYKRIESYAQTMVTCTENLMCAWGSGTQIDAEAAMMQVALNIVNKTLFNADVSGSADQIQWAMDRFQEIVGREVKSPSFLPTWLPTARNHQLKEALSLLDGVIFKIINERRTSGEDNGDLLSMLLLARDEDGNPMPDQQVRDEALTLFMAGHETTGSALAWALYSLATNPAIEAKLLDELSTVLEGRAPTLADLPRLPYTEMVVKETLRLYPPAWQTSRMATEDLEIGGVKIKKGTMVFVSPYMMHRDPRWWNDAETFRPERFAAGAEEKLPRYAYFPFGGGPRVCLGNTFALMESRLILATLLPNYRFTLMPGTHIAPVAKATLRCANGMPMEVSRR